LGTLHGRREKEEVILTSISDLHLEFCPAPELPGGDILVLAGDIFSAFPFRPWRQDAESRKARKRAETFCKTQLSKYQKVLYVTGNHEPYRELIEDSADILRLFLTNHAPNLTLLDNEMVEIGGISFMGTTLWARCGFDTGEEYRIANAMRDFSAIRTRHPPLNKHRFFDETGERSFAPEDAHRLHTAAKQWLQDSIPATKPVVLITHHAPTFLSGHGVNYGSAYLDDAYCGNLIDFFHRHPNIKFAVHGHTHHPEHYRIAETLIVSNPRGYFPMERQSRFFDPSAEDIDLEELVNGH
jgi:Icc-related predicted phosphoesterase